MIQGIADLFAKLLIVGLHMKVSHHIVQNQGKFLLKPIGCLTDTVQNMGVGFRQGIPFKKGLQLPFELFAHRKNVFFGHLLQSAHIRHAGYVDQPLHFPLEAGPGN
jgi:hypothetical protein